MTIRCLTKIWWPGWMLNLFEIFSFKFKHGNAANSLQQPGTAVITEKIAQKYFGNENPIGKMLKVSNEYDYTDKRE